MICLDICPTGFREKSDRILDLTHFSENMTDSVSDTPLIQ